VQRSPRVPCVWSFASENTGREGKRDGSYFALATKSEVSYTYTSNIAFAFSVFTAYTRWSNVTAVQEKLASEGDGVFLDRFNRLSFDGLSGEFLVRLLRRGPGQPVAVTASVEPRWSHVDFVTGFRADAYAAEFKLRTDFALAERLFGAVNLNYALGTQKFDIPNAEWERGSLINLSAALTAQVYAAEKQTVEGVFVGLEARYRTLSTDCGSTALPATPSISDPRSPSRSPATGSSPWRGARSSPGERRRRRRAGSTSPMPTAKSSA